MIVSAYLSLVCLIHDVSDEICFMYCTTTVYNNLIPPFFRELLSDDPGYYIPENVKELTTSQVLTSEYIQGLPIDKCFELDQDTRNWVSQYFKNLISVSISQRMIPVNISQSLISVSTSQSLMGMIYVSMPKSVISV